ncbi:hypothetical protein MMC30_004047 [Trapelia coarctata]|nr:hypothetical protein [Trapelia coarctata]
MDPSSFYSNPLNFFDSLGPNLPRPTSFPTANKIRKEARERSEKIFADWTTLHWILERHEEIIRKRWMKKTREQRKKVLLGAWPNMSSTHRPDFQALQRETPQQRSSGTKFREAFLWPYINLEDLSSSKLLLLFLNSRGHHLPEAFAHADYEASHVGMTSLAIQSPFLNEHTILLRGQTTPKTYGQLVAWDDDDEAFDLMHTGIGFHPGYGLQVLETQQEVLRFLVKCCSVILQDLPVDSLTSNDVPVQPELPLSLKNESEWPSLAAMASEAPYRVPAHLNFKHLQALVAGKRSAAMDHIWAMREDPGYFADIIGDYGEHRQETLLDVDGKRHPLLNRPLFWDRVLSSAILDAYGSFITWDVMCQQVTDLVTLNGRYSSDVTATKRLPSEFDKALQNFRHFLNRASKGPIANLKIGVPPSPPLRSLFVRERQQPGSTMIRVKTKSAMGKDILLHLFQTLWNEQELFLFGLPDVMDELDRLVQSDPKQKDRLSSWVAQVISDLAVIAQIRRQVGSYHPLLSAINEDTTDDMKADFSKSLSNLAGLMNNLKELSLASVGSPFDGKFHYPSDKRRTRETINVMRKAEVNLDLFWQTVDKHFMGKCRKTLHQSVPHLSLDDRQLQRTPGWIEPETQPEKEPKSESSEELYKPFSELSTTLEDRAGRSVLSENISPAKSKIKTRGVPQDTGPKAPYVEIEQEQPPKLEDQPAFTVSKRAFKVFSALFHNPAEPSQPGELPWADFLHAMAQTGFDVEKLYGSVWQFTPTKLDVERSIQFHEPHPMGKIPYRIARRHGRRLNRAYGWTGETFALAK